MSGVGLAHYIGGERADRRDGREVSLLWDELGHGCWSSRGYGGGGQWCVEYINCSSISFLFRPAKFRSAGSSFRSGLS